MKRRAVTVVLAAAVLPHAPVAHASTWRGTWCSPDRCDQRLMERLRRRRARREHHRQAQQAHVRAVVAPVKSWLLAVASCESGQRWHLSTGNGFYGGLQFTVSSWHAVGGVGYPHQTSRREQLYRGALLLRSQGPGAWPVCQASA